jgi:hypothetical protein
MRARQDGSDAGAEAAVGWRGRFVGVLLTLIAVLGFAVTNGDAASATGDYGPMTCLQGWVWRGAVSGDYVCVLPSVRSTNSYYNDHAASLHQPGSDQCLSGYTWRLVNSGDHVCVDPATRQQVIADNGQASLRRDSLNIAFSYESIPPSETCTGDICTQRPGSGPYYVLTLHQINIGPAIVRLYRSDNGAVKKSWSVNVPAAGYKPGGQLTMKTWAPACGRATDSYFRVYDSVSTRWSAPRYASTGCAFL